MTRARSILVVGVLAGFLALPAAASAETFTFGSNLQQPPSPGYYDACSESCTSAQLALPGATVTSPVSGTVVRFRLRTAAGSDPQKIKFRVLRGADGEKFTGVGTSKAFDIPTGEGTTTFNVNMPIRQGDYIGIDQPGDSKRANVIAVNNGAFQAAWFPALRDNATPKRSDNARGSAPTVFELLLQADVENQPADCTNNKGNATCPDPFGPPSMCGPTSAGFPQCNLPLDLPYACSGSGTGLPVCSLPQPHIVACGGFGVSIGACNFPPLRVPEVCGPTTAGLPPCKPANVDVLACGPTGVGLPACDFKTFIKAPKPIDINSGELDFEVSCPEDAASTGGRTAQRRRKGPCTVEFDLGLLAASKSSALRSEAAQLSLAYLNSQEYRIEWIKDSAIEEAAKSNYATFNLAAVKQIDSYIQARPGQDREPYRRLDSADANRIAVALRDQPYRGPTELYQNIDTLRANRQLSQAIVAAVNELYELQEQSRGSGSSAVAAAKLRKPLIRKRFEIPRGNKGKRIHIRLGRKKVAKLRNAASRKRNAVAVRAVVSFKAKPRPIVRYVDFRLKVKR